MLLLTEHYLDHRPAQILERDENFQTLHFRCHQIFDIHDFKDSRLQIPSSISAITAGFASDQYRVEKHLHMV
jgi:hypothetical protein